MKSTGIIQNLKTALQEHVPVIMCESQRPLLKKVHRLPENELKHGCRPTADALYFFDRSLPSLVQRVALASRSIQHLTSTTHIWS